MHRSNMCECVIVSAHWIVCLFIHSFIHTCIIFLFGVLRVCGVVVALPLHASAPLDFELIILHNLINLENSQNTAPCKKLISNGTNEPFSPM